MNGIRLPLLERQALFCVLLLLTNWHFCRFILIFTFSHWRLDPWIVQQAIESPQTLSVDAFVARRSDGCARTWISSMNSSTPEAFLASYTFSNAYV